MPVTFEDFLTYFRVKSVTNGTANAFCPAHNDVREPSLSISMSDDGEKILLHCHKNPSCAPEAITKSIGLKMPDLWIHTNGPASANRSNKRPRQNEPAEKMSKPPKEIARKKVCEYAYRKEDGPLLYVKERWAVNYDDGKTGKTFLIKRPKPGGGFEYKKPESGLTLYRLEDRRRVLAFPTNVMKIAIVIEGEKGVDTAHRIVGDHAWVTCAGGAANWKPEFGRFLEGFDDIIFLPDNDPDGENYVADAIASAGSIACGKLVLRLPGLPQKGDFHDWLELGGTAEEFWRLVAEARNSQTKTCGGLPSFPIEIFPKSFRDYAKEIAESLPCPIDFPGTFMLAAVGAAIGTGYVLEVKPGWKERPCIYAAVVAEPGDMKTPAIEAVMFPCYKLQDEFDQRYRERLKEHEIMVKVYQAEVYEAKREKRAVDGEPPAPPILEQCFTTDCTMEALAEQLYQNPRGLLFVNDELSGWTLSMNQYRGGKGNDKQKWLSFWSGASEMINRKGKPGVFLRNPFVNVMGGIQPDVLSMLDNEGKEDGFIHRDLFSFPAPLSTQQFSEKCVSGEVKDAYVKNFLKLRTLNKLPASDERNLWESKVLKFTKKARAVFIELHDKHLAEMSESNFPTKLRGPWAKLKGYAVRFALILHLMSHVNKDDDSDNVQAVDELSVLGAFTLIEYFKAHARKVYSQLQSSPEELQADRLRTWIAKQPHAKVTPRQVQMNHVARVKTANEARTLLKILFEKGDGKFEKDGSFILFSSNTQQKEKT